MPLLLLLRLRLVLLLVLLLLPTTNAVMRMRMMMKIVIGEVNNSCENVGENDDDTGDEKPKTAVRAIIRMMRIVRVRNDPLPGYVQAMVVFSKGRQGFHPAAPDPFGS